MASSAAFSCAVPSRLDGRSAEVGVAVAGARASATLTAPGLSRGSGACAASAYRTGRTTGTTHSASISPARQEIEYLFMPASKCCTAPGQHYQLADEGTLMSSGRNTRG